MNLEGLRREIDAIDADLVAQFCRRMAISGEVAAYKQAHGLAVRDAAREDAVLDKVEAMATPPFGAYTRMLYTEIFGFSRAYQEALLGRASQASADNRRYGLVGEKLAHSHSPMIHAMLASYTYALFELPLDALADFIRRPDIGGLNVTIPYKQAVLPLCDALSPQAARIGSVNTLVYDGTGRITGHNTDYEGFAAMAQEAGIAFSGEKVVILGSGGTARTAAHVAADAGAREIVLISRQGPDNYANLSRHADADILVNATPVGMYPHGNAQPVDLALFPRLRGVLDAIYNPLRTRLLLQAQARGLPCANGLTMLVVQAARSAELFLAADIPAPRTQMALAKTRASVENIVLIGMPGCGKTTVGRAVAAQMSRPLWDTDEMLVERLGMSIPDYFAAHGEAAFRAAEEAVIAEVSQHSGCVIATGGGSVLSQANQDALRQNGRLIFLRRPLSLLAAEGRPLSVNLAELEAARLPIYRRVSQATVDNDATIAEAISRVMEVIS